MIKITDDVDIVQFKTRFSSFDDGLLKSWNADFSDDVASLFVEIECRDEESPSGWSKVAIRLFGLVSLRFYEGPKASYRVLSNGLHITLSENLIGLEFGDLIDAPESFDEVTNSLCHAIGDSIAWEAELLP